MKCPKDGIELVDKSYKGDIEVESCPQCNGMWLDADELDTLEDREFDADNFKGSLVHRAEITKYPCPHCGEPLHEFQYRLYSLKIDYCANNGHGYWLDGGEAERVLELMDKREKEIKRKYSAESEFKNLLRSFRRKSLIDKLRDLFK